MQDKLKREECKGTFKELMAIYKKCLIKLLKKMGKNMGDANFSITDFSIFNNMFANYFIILLSNQQNINVKHQISI